LELNLWYADDGTLVRSIAKVAKAYQILMDDRPKYCFSLVSHKTSLWWRTKDFVQLRLLFDCRLDIDDNDLPLPVIVLVGSPVGYDDFVKQHLIVTSTKVHAVLGMIADMENAQISSRYIAPISPSFFSHRFLGARHRSKRSQRQRCWTICSAFGSTACHPLLPPLTMARLRQAALPI
jgi:hypothetical protein